MESVGGTSQVTITTPRNGLVQELGNKDDVKKAIEIPSNGRRRKSIHHGYFC